MTIRNPDPPRRVVREFLERQAKSSYCTSETSALPRLGVMRLVAMAREWKTKAGNPFTAARNWPRSTRPTDWNLTLRSKNRCVIAGLAVWICEDKMAETGGGESLVISARRSFEQEGGYPSKRPPLRTRVRIVAKIPIACLYAKSLAEVPSVHVWSSPVWPIQYSEHTLAAMTHGPHALSGS